MQTPAKSYESTADALANRISDLIPANPQILSFDSAWKLFEVPGFSCDDLSPSAFQAGWAMARAKEIHAERSK